MSAIVIHRKDYAQPAGSARQITTNSSQDIEFASRALYIGGTGNLVVTMLDDSSTVTFSAVPGGTVLPIAVKRVHATSTCTAIVALF